MEYKITHVTNYDYSQPVSVCHNVVMQSPQTSGNVLCHSHRINIRPNPGTIKTRHDFFGNLVHSFSIEENHRQLTITAHSRVRVNGQSPQPGPNGGAWRKVADGVAQQTIPDWLSLVPFVFDSPRIRRCEPFLAYALQSFTPDRSVLEATRELNGRIRSEFTYDKVATNVNTPTLESFRLKRGVCQDFAHVLVACLRSVGIPAKYVSGYLRTIPPPGKERLIGADQSHAWASVYCGPQLGWIDFDPTNNCLCGEDHIPIAQGRDYDDVVPLKGVFLGGGEHRLNVSVDVLPVPEAMPTDY